MATKTETYVWKGKSPKGDVITGEYKAENRRDVADYLRKRRIIILQQADAPPSGRSGQGDDIKGGIRSSTGARVRILPCHFVSSPFI